MEKELIGTIVIEKRQLPDIRVGQTIKNGRFYALNGDDGHETYLWTPPIEKVEWLGGESFRVEIGDEIYHVVASEEE